MTGNRSDKQQLLNALRSISAPIDGMQAPSGTLCIVVDVNLDDPNDPRCYCVPVGADAAITDGSLDESSLGADIPNVRVIADVSGEGFIQVPKVGARVVVSFLTGNIPFISLHSGLQTARLNGSTLNFKGVSTASPKIVMNDGANKGMVKGPQLMDVIRSIESRLDSLCLAISAAVPVAGDGGAAIKAAILAATYQDTNISTNVTTTKPMSQPLSVVDSDVLLNKDITH